MDKLRFTAAVGVLCLMSAAGAPPARTAPSAPVLAVMQSELQRNVEMLRDQLGVTTAFDDATLVEHDDLIGLAHGREAMRDDNRRAAVAQLEEPLVEYPELPEG